MRSITNSIVAVICFVLLCYSINELYAEETYIEIYEWDDAYMIINGSSETLIDCVPDEDTTQDMVGFCNIIQQTYGVTYD